MSQSSSHRKHIAVIGASSDRSKFGNKCVRAYARAGWRVYPVHPVEEEIEGFEAYSSIREVPATLDRVSMYLPPGRGIETLEDIQRVHPKEVWLNPGTESPELLAKAKKLKLNVVQACSIVAIGLSPADLPE